MRAQRGKPRYVAGLVAGAILLGGVDTAAQDGMSPTPVAPPVMTRDAAGHVTIRAIRVEAAPHVDGVLDEELYRTLEPITGFIQQDPDEGQLATEPTLVWLLFDQRTIYISARCLDSQPSRIVANDMRRDGRNVSQNDNLSVVLDTFHDRRNGYEFLVNSIGGMWDSQLTDERDANRDWNTIWVSRSRRDDKGWTVEMAIPFRSLRYRGSGPQVWGINIRRNVRWKNELSYLSPVPRQYGARGILRLSQAATLVGLEAPPTALNLDIKPYTLGSVSADRVIDPGFTNELDGNAGFDLKYVMAQRLTADFTYRTDFAQVEDDDLQVNLTRFNLFFPEKREFFLEGQGIFAFGGAQTTSTTGNAPSNTPVLFFSRRIGLSGSRVVPMDVGGRLTGRVGRYTIGVLDVKTDDEPEASAFETNFAVVRVKRDILRRSYVGVLGTYRNPTVSGTNDNGAFGIDTNLSFYTNLNILGYYAETRTPGIDESERSYRGRFDYDADLLGIQVERLKVGEGFNPEVGFLRRTDFIQNLAQLRVSRRPRTRSAIRKISLESGLEYITNNDEQLENRQARLGVRTEMQSGDSWNVQYARDFEWVDEPFTIVGLQVPGGAYHFSTMRGGYTLGTQRRISGEISAARGTFYDGDRTELSYRGRAEISSRLSVEPTVSLNWVDLPAGRVTATLVSGRGTLSFTPRMLVAALIQYNSAANLITTNIRYRWEYHPGSELFVVYSDGRDTRHAFGGEFPSLLNRGFTIKLTRLFRM
ncbi:MAG TPA: DUF5916 domain-containing protein [Vicinamibacterales bacterium]|nr:DUF5916 domain-containing protein [Vicinamibacterales bacterium]